MLVYLHVLSREQTAMNWSIPMIEFLWVEFIYYLKVEACDKTFWCLNMDSYPREGWTSRIKAITASL